jgi:hypothetical protein
VAHADLLHLDELRCPSGTDSGELVRRQSFHFIPLSPARKGRTKKSHRWHATKMLNAIYWYGDFQCAKA